MPNQPSCPSPYLSSIDASSENITFSCLVKDPVYGYILTVKDADNGEELFTEENMTFATESFNEDYTTPSPIELVNADGANYLEIPLSIDNQGILENGKNYVWSVRLYSGNLYKNEVKLIKGIYSYYDFIKVSKEDVIYPLLHIGLPTYIERTKNSITKSVLTTITRIDKSEDNSKELHFGAIDTVKTYTYSASFFIGLHEVQSPDYYFVAKKNPDITFEVNPTITSSVLDVSVSYFQEQMATVSYYCFNLYSEDEELIDTTGNVFSSNIKYLYNGLISNNKYVLELTIVDSNKNKHTIEREFYVEYNNYQTYVIPEVSINQKDGCVEIDYSKNVVIEGKTDEDSVILFKNFIDSATETVLEHSNGICLNRGQSLYWNDKTGDIPLDLDNTCQIIHWHGHEGFYGTIFEKIDERNPANNILVRYDGTAFYYKFGLDNEVTYSPYDEDTLSAINVDEDTIDEEKLYIINDTNELQDEYTLFSNDLTSKYWWFIVILQDEVRFIKGKLYSETVVSA